MISSYKYAKKLKELAEFMLGREEFKLESGPYLYQYFWSGNKVDFLAAAKGLGSGKKDWTDSELKFTVEHGAKLAIAITRSAVCKKVQEEKWECEPLLSEEEIETVGK